MPTTKPARQIDIADLLNQQHLCESISLNEVKSLMAFTEPVYFKKVRLLPISAKSTRPWPLKNEVALFFEDHAKDVEIGRLNKGEVMGEMSFFDRQARSARIRASVGDTRLLKLTRTVYKRLRVEHPFIAVNLLEHAIISLDHLFRRLSLDITRFNQYMYGNGPIR